MRRLAALVTLGALAACDGSRSTDTRSETLPSPQARVQFLCAYALCPSQPKDAVFHLVFRDRSRRLFGRADELDLRAVVLVDRDDLERWQRGCQPAPVDARPAWLTELAADRRFLPTSAPDGYRCGRERRALHVKDGLVVWRITSSD